MKILRIVFFAFLVMLSSLSLSFSKQMEITLKNEDATQIDCFFERSSVDPQELMGDNWSDYVGISDRLSVVLDTQENFNGKIKIEEPNEYITPFLTINDAQVYLKDENKKIISCDSKEKDKCEFIIKSVKHRFGSYK